MDKVSFLLELANWSSDGDPFREAILIKEAPIAPSTLVQLKSGKYNPSERMISALRGVMARHPLRKKSPGPEAA